MNSFFSVGCRLTRLLPFVACLLPLALYAQPDTRKKPYKFAVWTGLAYNIILGGDDIGNGNDLVFTPVFGVEVSLKKPGQRLTLIAAGNRSVNKYFSQASREGVNGEIGLALLQSPVGKLSGKESKASIGVEMRVGRQGFSYEVEYDIPDPHPYRIENKSNWVKLMGRFGWRLLFGKRFFVDSGLPIGLQLGTIKVTQTDLITGDQTVYRSSPKGLAVLPSLAIGCRF